MLLGLVTNFEVVTPQRAGKPTVLIGGQHPVFSVRRPTVARPRSRCEVLVIGKVRYGSALEFDGAI